MSTYRPQTRPMPKECPPGRSIWWVRSMYGVIDWGEAPDIVSGIRVGSNCLTGNQLAKELNVNFKSEDGKRLDVFHASLTSLKENEVSEPMKKLINAKELAYLALKKITFTK